MGERTRNRPSSEGRELGAQLARLCDEAEPAARLRMPGIQPRCTSCAFRAGTIPNGCVPTVMDALKCVIEGVEFRCHQVIQNDGSASLLCSGWAMMMLAKTGSDGFGIVPWPFSDEALAEREG